MKRPRARWPIAATAAALVMVLAVPASGAEDPWSRAPRTGSADVSARRAKPMPAVAPAERDALTRALERGRIDPATYALERARALFDLRAVRSRYGDVGRADPREATLILRDLVLRLDELSAAQLRQARAILARPTDMAGDPFGDGYTVAEGANSPLCSSNGCIHYVDSTDDAPDSTNEDMNPHPDYVDDASAIFEEVWAKEVTDYGYRPPKSDGTSPPTGNPNEDIDIYIVDVGADGLYGYCTTDDPNAEEESGYDFFDYSAYCVVDDDFSALQFPGVTGLDALRVTMAHEFFHAVQFAYDAAEDTWFMESSATWMEDEVYDSIDDNWQYFPQSPLGQPQVPLDSNNRFNVYGDWIFHRFLAESSEDTRIIRRIWRNADAAPGGRDDYSLKAIEKEIVDEGAKFRWAFADFGMWNDVPEALYDEGADYPFAPPTEIFKITRRKSGVIGSKVLDHLTSRYIWFRPGRGVQTDAKLWVGMDGPAYKTGPEASVVVLFKSGKVQLKPLAVNKKGQAGIVVKFGKGKIAEVDLVMTNASIRRRTACWTDLPKWRYACAALPKDDNMRYVFAAELIQ